MKDITADLVSFEKYRPFLKRLFSTKTGNWTEVKTLCNDLSEIRSVLDKVPGRMFTTWIDFPESVYGEGYCIIIFFIEELHWYNIALFNASTKIRDRHPDK